MSRKSKKAARIWNKYICPTIEIAGYTICALAATVGFWLICVATILLFG